MPLRQETQFLGQCAQRLGDIAGVRRRALSNQRRKIAAELDERADQLEKTDLSSE